MTNKRGAPKGSIQKASASAGLLALAIGERVYIETTATGSADTWRAVIPARSRRPPALAGREFVCRTFTAVGAGKTGEIRYLLCVERVQ